MPYSELVNAALILAATAHRDQKRKGTETPYIVHPIGVMLELLYAGETDQDMLAAAVLHDTVEDAGITLDALRAQFGERVARIVEGCSEPDKSATWEVRKQHTVAYLKTAPREVQLVAAADKLHNLRSMQTDYAQLGETLWGRFKRGKPAIAWYYRAVTESLRSGDLRDHPLLVNLAHNVENFFGAET